MYPSSTGSKCERQTHDIRHQLGKFIWLCHICFKQTLGHLQTPLVILRQPKTTNDSYAFQYTPDTKDKPTTDNRHKTTPTTTTIERRMISGCLWFSIVIFSCPQYLQSSQSLSLVVYSLYCLSWRGCSQSSIVVYSNLLTLGASFIKGSLRDVAQPRSSLACIVWLVVSIVGVLVSFCLKG